MKHPLSELAEIHSGHQSRKAIVALPDGSHRLLQLRDFSERKEINLDHLVRFTPEKAPSDLELQEGDVLFNAKGAVNFAVALTSVHEPTLAAAYFFIVRPRQGLILPAYLAWYLNQEPAQLAIRRQTGSGVLTPTVRRGVLENLEIPVPPLSTQEKIVAATKLLNEELHLMQRLAAERHRLVTRLCLNAAIVNHAEKSP